MGSYRTSWKETDPEMRQQGLTTWSPDQKGILTAHTEGVEFLQTLNAAWGTLGVPPERGVGSVTPAFPQHSYKLFCQQRAAAKGYGNGWPLAPTSEKITDKHVYQKPVMTFFIASMVLKVKKIREKKVEFL